MWGYTYKKREKQELDNCFRKSKTTNLKVTIKSLNMNVNICIERNKIIFFGSKIKNQLTNQKLLWLTLNVNKEIVVV